uniref:TATA box binding protein (TBP)-associated factor, RNA polymerase I, A n=1 Tax=Scophthalmus maximus TaxID=52904 RepID=A0A8D3BAR2_SCOMX
MDDTGRELRPLEDPEDDCYSSSSDDTPENGFHQSTRICLEYIREAMLHHRWQEAAEYMACYPQMLEDTSFGYTDISDLVWRLSTEILHHHPNSNMDDYNSIYERMKHSGFKHYLKISLEHSFHLLLHGHIVDAKRQLLTTASWRYGKEQAVQHQKAKLIHAYRSLLDYILWCDKKVSNSDPGKESCDIQEKNNNFRQASVNLKEIVRNPGVWDPFILSYVEMLEFYKDHKEALSVLNDYAYDNNFPPNPNAHVYLYQYLKRHDAPEKKLLKVLKILHVSVPSHELMLEYSSLLLQSGKLKESDIQKAFRIIVEMLDFACWRSNLDVWNSLKAIIQKLKSQKDWRKVVHAEMAGRKDWWPVLHFTSFHASKDSDENPDLMEVKASLINVLCPGETVYIRVLSSDVKQLVINKQFERLKRNWQLKVLFPCTELTWKYFIY